MANGAITLGCLLGAYGQGQSFAVVSSWSEPSSPMWVGSYGAAVAAHSSASGIRAAVTSAGAGTIGLRYTYADAAQRFSPDVSTHDLVARVWARASAAINSGEATFYAGSASVPVPFHASALQPLKVESLTITASVPLAGFTFGTASAFTLFADDVLVAVDVIQLHPTWEAEDQGIALVADSEASAWRGRYVYGRTLDYSMPLRLVPSSVADLLNFWWRNGFALALTLSTSDAEALRVVRIANQTEPVVSRNRARQDLLDGMLLLHGLTPGALEF